MQTGSSSRLISDQSSNPTSSTNLNPKGRNRRRSKQRIENANLEEHFHPVVAMADQRTMAELLRAPTEGLEKDNLHDHIRWFNKITSTIKYKDVPSSAIKLMIFPFSLAGAARRWLEKEPPRSIHTWEDLHVLTIIENKSKVCNSRSKVVVSQVKACDVNSNSSKIVKLTYAVNQQTSDVTTAMTAMLKQFQATPPPTLVKAVEEIGVTCGGAHPYYQCLAAGGNTFPELGDNIQGYVSAAAVNYNQGNPSYRPPGLANQIRPPGFAQPNVQNNQN
uniref:Reverse transcriptase domain-containing protein n=1 Tax=Tanacetum cinerariifolium TaxID=118510 RepID=A0A699H7L8_TANCI|nr:hypothetical protein [Tanacetum cinerariifolium]